MSLLDDFVRIFQMPPAMIPHIDFVVQGREMELVVTLGDGPKTSEQISETLHLSAAETDALLQSAFTRYVVNRKTDDGVTTYTPGAFYRRLDPMSMYENWGDVPVDARDAVIDWQLAEFIAIWQPIIEDIRRDPDAHVRIPNRDVLLLDEALAMVEAANLHVVVPCDCRAIVMACKRPSEACIRLDKGAESTLERGHGRQLTKDEMKALVIDCHRAGLMHTGRRAWREYGELYGFCNCCACDCYPFRGGIKLDMHRQWPRAHYVAERDMSKCEQCGKCVQRCHFGAFYRDTVKVEVNGKQRYRVLFDASKCYGCGLCATTCPDEAITMQPLAEGAPAVAPQSAVTPDEGFQGYYEMAGKQ